MAPMNMARARTSTAAAMSNRAFASTNRAFASASISRASASATLLRTSTAPIRGNDWANLTIFETMRFVPYLKGQSRSVQRRSASAHLEPFVSTFCSVDIRSLP